MTMAEPGFQRSGLPLLFLAAFMLAVGVGLVILLASPFTEGFFRTGTERSAGTEESEQPAAPEPEPEPAPEPAPEPSPEPAPPPTAETAAPAPASHSVVAGDTLFDLAARYWSDPYRWPVLLVRNTPSLSDPDFLRQGSRLTIGEVPEDIDTITAAHVNAYRRYKDLGNDALTRGRRDDSYWLAQLGRLRLNKSVWVLYSGLRYDRGYLDRASGIDDEDLATVRRFIRDYGPAPGVK